MVEERSSRAAPAISGTREDEMWTYKMGLSSGNTGQVNWPHHPSFAGGEDEISRVVEESKK
jgi:hypothetical protein